MELGSSTSQKSVAQVLSGRRSYDDLTVDEQAVVRAEWSELIHSRLAGLDLVSEFAEQGETYIDMDDQGRLVRHQPDGTVIEVIDAPGPMSGT